MPYRVNWDRVFGVGFIAASQFLMFMAGNMLAHGSPSILLVLPVAIAGLIFGIRNLFIP